MSAVRANFLIALVLLIGGCAHRSASPATAPSASLAPTTAPSDPAHLTLDQILPRPVLAPSSRPAEDAPASLEALTLYARGMDALYQGKAADAIDAFLNAIKLDPYSFALYDALGHAYLQRTRSISDPALTAFGQAAVLKPDDLQIHLLLAREYFELKNTPKAVEQLRLAEQTSDYRADEIGSAAVELFLARGLQEQGYDRAALEQYQRISARMANGASQLRNDPDIGFVVNEPELLWLQIAQLNEKLDDYPAALAAYEPSSQSDPANFQLAARVVEILVTLHRSDEATVRAAEVVERFHASPGALELLRKVSQSVGYDKEVAVLRRLHQQNPKDRSIVLALADVLDAQGKAPAARQVLEEAGAANPGDLEIVRSLFDFYLAHDDSPAAARLLAMQMAAEPDSVRQLDPLLAELIHPMRKHPLRLAVLQNLAVPPGATAGRLYMISQAASQWRRDMVARQSLEQAIKISPPFAPVFRAWLADEWSRQELGAQQKIDASEALAASVRQNSPALAAEIRGISLFNQDKSPQAVDAFAQARQLGAPAPDLELEYALALRQSGNNEDFEKVMWALVATDPAFDQAWDTLHEFYLTTSNDPDALRALSGWLKSNPASEMARLYEAAWQLRHNDQPQGQEGLNELLEEHSDDAELTIAIEKIFDRMGLIDDFIARLEKLHAGQPTNLPVVGQLASIYMQKNRSADASSLLDQTRALLSGDADSLYVLASLYHDIGQDAQWEKCLSQILEVDRQNVPASNDLGYAWADEGKNLDRAEEMIRVAVAAEPDNQAFLDSMGWVLYKRGRFADARKFFEQAVNPAQSPDAEVLNHFGDVLYRMGQGAEAQKQWQRALQQMQQASSEGPAMQFRLKVQRKINDAASGQTVEVAPIAAPSTRPDAEKLDAGKSESSR